jgi:transposase
MMGEHGGSRVPSEGTIRMARLRIVDVREWRSKIAAALKASGGYVQDAGGRRGAASRLDVGRATLHRWIRQDAYLASISRPGRGRPRKRRMTKERTCE